MKGNDGSGNVPEGDSWETDQALWDKLNEQYHFDFDCCASEENAKTELFSDDFESVQLLFTGTCWMNPPFSKAREMFEHFFKVVHFGVAIYRFDNAETKIWQEVIFPNASWVFVPKGRIAYTSYGFCRQEGVGVRFPSALIGIGVPSPRELDGVVLVP